MDKCASKCGDKWVLRENGEIMLESMIIVVITLFILIWLLGLGFLYYQRYVAITTTNDVAVKIASTYNNPTSDIIMGYVTTEDLSTRDLYRGFNLGNSKSDLLATNNTRAEAYVKYKLEKLNFTNSVESVDVKIELVSDSVCRKHIKVTTTCTFNTPFGAGLKWAGMDAKTTYETTSSADCSDMADYISTVDFGAALLDGRIVSEGGFVTSLVKMLNSFVGAFNQLRS